MTECEEIAENVGDSALASVKSFDDARIIAKGLLFSDETQTVIDNIAQAIWERAYAKANRP